MSELGIGDPRGQLGGCGKNQWLSWALQRVGGVAILGDSGVRHPPPHQRWGILSTPLWCGCQRRV